MICTKEGVIYDLQNFNSEEVQSIQFTHKNEEGKYEPGTTNEEVIDMLIERQYSLQKKKFSTENEVIIMMLKDIRRLLKKRLSNKIQTVKKSHEKYPV